MKRYLLAAVAVAAFATPAAAQDFSGIRVEARAGYDWVSLNADITEPTGTFEADSNEDGFMLGLEGGYDFAVSNNFILGVYGGIDFSSADFCRTVGLVDQACLEVKRNFYQGARAGMQVGSSTLLYAKAGYSNGQAEIELNDVDNVVSDLVDSDNRDGWHFGFGVEQNFGSMFYGKLEFVQTFYGDLDFANQNLALSLDGDRSQIVAGIGLRF